LFGVRSVSLSRLNSYVLASAAIVHPPDLTKEFYLWTNVSSKGFRAILEQQGNEGKRYPVAFASQQTKQT